MENTRNRLGRLYDSLPFHKRSKILADYKAAKVTPQRFYNWLNCPDDNLVNIPMILKNIFCKNIPQAEKLFKLPDPEVPTLFDQP